MRAYVFVVHGDNDELHKEAMMSAMKAIVDVNLAPIKEAMLIANGERLVEFISDYGIEKRWNGR